MITEIVLATAAISVYIFYHPTLVDKLGFSAYRVVHKREYYRLASHMFVHGSWAHLIVNMLVLWSFGRFIEQVFYAKTSLGEMHAPTLHLLLVYFGAGITAALLQIGRNKDNLYSMSIGASGGVAAVMFSSILFAPWQMIYLFGLVPIPGILCGLGYLYYEWKSAQRGGDGIDHHAHIYGAIFGFLYPITINTTFAVDFLHSLIRLPWL